MVEGNSIPTPPSSLLASYNNRHHRINSDSSLSNSASNMPQDSVSESKPSVSNPASQRPSNSAPQESGTGDIDINDIDF